MKLDDKVVLVTGANDAIGAAIVQAVIHAGGRAIAHHHRRRDRIDALVHELGEDRVRLVAADLAREGAAGELWAAAHAWRGRVDVLVNNAAILTEAPLELPAEDWHRRWEETLRVNLIAPAALVRAALPRLREGGGGVIINIASRAAFRGDPPEYMHYAASKAGLVALTRSVARAYGRDNVLAYVVAPGFVDTDMVAGVVPLGELAPPHEVASAVVVLASGALRHATGETIHLNGGAW